MRRVNNKWEVVTRVLGHNIWIGAYDYRSEAIKAEEIANKIRSGLDRCEKTAKLIGRYKLREEMAGMKITAMEPGF